MSVDFYSSPLVVNGLSETPAAGGALSVELRRAAEALRGAFGAEFALYEPASGECAYHGGGPPLGDPALIGELVRAVAGRREPEFIGEEGPVLILAIPIVPTGMPTQVAVGAFVTRPLQPGEAVERTAALLGLDPRDAARWINAQPLWTAGALRRMARAARENAAARQRIEELEFEVDKVSANLAATYEEISLLYGLTQNLRLSAGDDELARIALDWLLDVIPAKSVVVQYLPVVDTAQMGQAARTESVLLTSGECPLDNEQFTQLVAELRLDPHGPPRVMNRAMTHGPKWPFAEVRELIVVPLTEGDNVFGWLAAVNHRNEEEFGTVEASLLSSVGAILGVHSGNIELYRQQAEFLAGVVHALTSAIDAKDPYTCGHSDRVARAAVRLAQELGCDTDTINTLYMAGLLHDIGKIGIDDSVLRKPGKLTEAEYEHIKLHPELGHKILEHLKQFADVLPVVLHHHEQWDGKGYPRGLQGDQTPISARIVAVADAFDAMSSDRPYRKGMPDDKVDEIFRHGAGKQWDAKVVEAFFKARADLREIGRRERAGLTLDVQQWT